MLRSLCSVLIVCLLAARVSAHGGTLHPGGPEQNNFIRAKVASCSKWVPASGTLKDSKVVPSAAKLAPVDVKGSVILWQYLYRNCSIPEGGEPTAGGVFNVTITRNGKPLSDVTLDGLGMTGSCAANGVKPFFFNPDAEPVDDKRNKLWFTNYTTKADGKVAGNGANDGYIRTVTKGDKEAVKSMVIVDMKTQNILSCCDLQPAGPANSNWTKSIIGKGKVCEEEEGHGAHGAKGAHGAAPAATKLANATDNHAGHDHSHEANGTNVAGGGTAKAAKSAAGGVSAGAGGVLSVVAAAVVLLAL